MLQKRMLLNGTTLLLQQIPYAKSICCYGYFPYGVATEEFGQQGITHLLEHLQFSGIEGYPSALDVASGFEEIGVDFEAATSRDMVMLGIQSPIQSFLQGFDLLTEVLLRANFLESQFQNEQQVLEEELIYYTSEPEMVVTNLVSQTLWGTDHPLGRHIAGQIQDILKLSYEDVKLHYKKHYVPEKLVLVIAGAFENDQMELLIDRFQNRYPMQNSIRTADALRPLAASLSGRFVQHHNSSDLSWVGIAYPFLETPIDRIKTDLLTTLLTEGNAAVLQQSMREEQGLLYNLMSNDNTSRIGGDYQLLFCTDSRKWESTLNAVQRELSKSIDFSQQSFQVAKSRLFAKLTFTLETTKYHSRFIGRNYMIHNTLMNIDDALISLSSLSITDLRKYLDQLIQQPASIVHFGPSR